MDAADYEAVIQQHVDASEADLSPEVRAALDAASAEWAGAKTLRERREAALAELVQERARQYGAAWEQVLRAAGDPEAVQWRDPAPRPTSLPPFLTP